MLAWLGDRVEKVRVPLLWRVRRTDGEPRVWGWILDRVLRHPLVSAAACRRRARRPGSACAHLHTAISGLDALPKSLKETQSYNRVNDAFPGRSDPRRRRDRGRSVEPALRAAVADLRGLGRSPPARRVEPISVDVAPGGEAMQVAIPLVGKGTDSTSNDALATLRDELLPATVGTVDGVEYAVTGDTAASKDWNDAMSSAVPIVFGFVLAFAFLLLLVSFRSIVIPLKAILMNLLSVAAAYGVIVAIFQWGWGENLLDFNSNGGVASWLPMFLFVILFGLSMDYHVFILSRVREYYDRGLSTPSTPSRRASSPRPASSRAPQSSWFSCSASSPSCRSST